MTLQVVLIITSSISLIFSFLTALFAIKAYIEVKAMEKSTHSLQYVPVDPEIDKANQEFMAQDKWASSEKAIHKQNELYKEEIEEKLPEFALSDEDKEVFSL